MSWRAFMTRHKRDGGVLTFLILYIIVMGFRHAEFLDFRNPVATIEIHLDIFRQASLYAIVAAGMTLVIVAGGIDLSVGSVLILSSSVGAGLMVANAMPVAGAFTVCILLGLLLGGVNGTLSSWGGINSFIVTLGMMSAARGLAYLYCDAVADGTTIYGLPQGARFLSGKLTITDAFYVPVPAVIMAVVYMLMHIVLMRTKLGRYSYAVGASPAVARLAGLPVNWVKVAVFCICGGLSALAGFIYIGNLESANAQGLPGFELEVIAAVVIGGTSLMGGEGRVLGSLVGALLIAYIRDGLTRENAGSGTGRVVIGLIIVAAVALDRVMKMRGAASGARA